MTWESIVSREKKNRVRKIKKRDQVCDVMNIFLYLLVKYCYDVMITKWNETNKKKKHGETKRKI